MSVFKGSGVALITPFKLDSKGNSVVDYDTLYKLLDFHLENGTDAIIVCGTTGEASTMTKKEHIEIIKKCVNYVNGRLPIIAGTGSNNTNTAVKLSQRAEEVGADALLCVTPYYNKTNQDGLKLYYKRIADSVDIPVIMYNVPSRTGLNIKPETAIDIAKDNENIVGIKEASGNIDNVIKLNNANVLDIYSGNDNQIYEIMNNGGIGVISVLANIYPNIVHDMVMEYLNGNIGYSYIMQEDAMDLIDNLFSDVNPIPVKKAMEYLNMNSGILREPLIELSEEKTKTLVKSIGNFNKKNRY